MIIKERNNFNFTEEEILGWNDKLEGSNIKVMPVISNYKEGFNISLLMEHDLYSIAVKEHTQLDEPPEIEYMFSFSVSEKRKDDFFKIFNDLFKNRTLTTKFVYGSVEKDIDKNANFISEENEHIVNNNKYIRYTYYFKDKLIKIMAYIAYLEDAINYFQLIWGYDKDGKEITLPKYPISSIVSISNDKSEDYIVIDYDFHKIGNEYKYFYVLLEIINDNNPIIKYGKQIIEDVNNISFSRNDRINNILN